MDELDLLHDVLSNPEPSADMVDNRRYELQRLINQRTRPRTRMPGWRISALGLTAAAAAVAATVVLTQHPAPVTPRRTHPQSAAAQPTGSAQQILLTAATSAQQAPVASGSYWYVHTRAKWNDNTLTDVETWTKRDGETWQRTQKTGNKVIHLPAPPPSNTVLGPFFLGGQKMTVSQIENLPTDPTALTTWIVANAAAHGGKSGGPAPDAARQREDVFESLDSLLSQLPAPPAVRAAAFRALAALPGVTALGPIDGGQGIRFTTIGGAPATLVIDPATGQVRATNYFVTNDGAMFWQPTVDATITCQWTNTLP